MPAHPPAPLPLRTPLPSLCLHTRSGLATPLPHYPCAPAPLPHYPCAPAPLPPCPHYPCTPARLSSLCLRTPLPSLCLHTPLPSLPPHTRLPSLCLRTPPALTVFAHPRLPMPAHPP